MLRRFIPALCFAASAFLGIPAQAATIVTTLHYPADFPDPNLGGGVLFDPYNGGTQGPLAITFSKPLDPALGEFALLTLDAALDIFSYRYTSADSTTAVRSFDLGDNNSIGLATYYNVGQRIDVPQLPFGPPTVEVLIPASAPGCIDSVDNRCYPFGGYVLSSGIIQFMLEMYSAEPVTITITAITGGVPEPATWSMMILGIGFVGAAQRSRARRHRLGTG